VKSSITACPLDCYDACGIVYSDKKLQPFYGGHTNGFLCSHLNHYEKFARVDKPRYKGQEITMQEALWRLRELLHVTPKDAILHYRGSGNFALMQAVTDHFFATFGATLTDGTLCDGAGEAGIMAGRGSNKNMPLSEIKKSDVVIFWGRNPHTTSSHILPLIKGKKIIVIDPVKTKIAQVADLHVQIRPHMDLYFALLLTRHLSLIGGVDEEFIQKYASGFDAYCKFIKKSSADIALEKIGVTSREIEDIVAYCVNKRVAIVCGVGIQKYRDGADVMRSIDAFAISLGLFGKEGCGVAYLGDSKEGIVSPFYTKAKRVSKVDTKFDAFETVFIQGANPLAQMPDSLRAKNALQKTQNIIYFGLYENETSQIADLVIPAKTFLEKDDIRTSYAHHGLMVMQKLIDSDIGISEYELTSYLCKEFAIALQSEEAYLKHFQSFGVKRSDGCFEVANRERVAYRSGFDTSDGKFCFLKKLKRRDDENEKSFYLITPKSHTSLNSQFKRQKHVYMHPLCGYRDGEEVEIVSKNGSVVLSVKNDERVRPDTVLIYSGTVGVNNLTPSVHSYEGKSAVFQEKKVIIIKK